MSPPLAGVRVVELATEIAGPYAGKLLADAGAEVIKVGSTAGGDPLRGWTACGATVPPGTDAPLFRFLNRGKQAIVVDGASADGQAQLLALVAGADVVVQSPGSGATLAWES